MGHGGRRLILATTLLALLILALSPLALVPVAQGQTLIDPVGNTVSTVGSIITSIDDTLTDPIENTVSTLADTTDTLVDTINDTTDSLLGSTTTTVASSTTTTPASTTTPTTAATSTNIATTTLVGPEATTEQDLPSSDPSPGIRATVSEGPSATGRGETRDLMLLDRSVDSLQTRNRDTAASTEAVDGSLFDRLLAWLVGSDSVLLGVIAGPLIALQVLVRALLSAGSGLVAPTALLAAYVLHLIWDNHRERTQGPALP